MSGPPPGLRIRFLHLAVLSTFAFAQPLFGTLAANPLFLEVRGAGAVEVWSLVAAALLGPPALLAAIEGGAHAIAPRAAWRLHLAFIGLLAGLSCVPSFNRIGAWSAVAGPMAAGIAVASGYARWPALRLFTTYLVPVVVVAPALFVARSPVDPWRAAGDPSRRDATAVALEPAAVRRPLPIAMLVFDELPLVTLLDAEGRPDRTRHPSFASLASQSLWARNATTDASHTRRALPALLSSRLPDPARAHDSGGAPTLFELLSRTHAITAAEPLVPLCPASICERGEPVAPWRRIADLLRDAALVRGWFLTPLPLRAFVTAPIDLMGAFGRAGIDRAHSGEAREDPSREPAELRRFLESLRADPSGRPVLLFAHVMLPHQPFVFLPTGQRYRAGDDRSYRPWASEDDALEFQRRHAAQAAYADAVLGMFVDRVKRLGIWDEGIVVVTADHGLGFIVGSDPRNASAPTVGEVGWIPLFVRAPGVPAGTILDRASSTVDVPATILDLLAASAPSPLDGRSLLRPSAPDRARRIVNDRGGAVPLEPTTRALDAALRRKLDRVGAGPFEAMFRSGRGGALVFRGVDELPAGDPVTDIVVTIANLEQYARVDASGPYLPALIAGNVASARSLELAVALNGKIAAVASVPPPGVLSRKRRWQAFLPWMLLRTGGNDVQLFEVDRSMGTVRLRAIRRVPDDRA